MQQQQQQQQQQQVQTLSRARREGLAASVDVGMLVGMSLMLLPQLWRRCCSWLQDDSAGYRMTQLATG
jgi:hypothetical protein